MSMPKFPSNEPPLSREDVINQIISSIAMEELGLSHIINAEGEKLQYALGTIEGVKGPDEPLTLEELLKLNDSVHETLNGTMMNQFFLKEKLVKALSASIMQGPAGPAGPIGPAGENGTNGTNGVTPNISIGNVETVDYPEDADVQKDTASTETDVIFDFWIPRGPTGPGIRLLNSYDDPAQFYGEHPAGNPGDSYMVEGYLLTWDETSGSWLNLGYFRGSAGEDGMSAFELAEEHGFTGTEDEWLESLKGETGAVAPLIYAQL